MGGFMQAPRLTVDTYNVPAAWNDAEWWELPGIYSLWIAPVGGDIRIRWAPISGGHPDWSLVDPDGELVEAGGAGEFDHLEDTTGRWQFKLDNAGIASVVSFKAQAMFDRGGVG